MREREPVNSKTTLASCSIENSIGLPMLMGPTTSSAGPHQPHQAIDEVVDVAERARLGAVAVDRNIASEQRLDDEVRNDPAVMRMHARPIGIEDARDLDAQFVLPPIVEEQRFRAALAFIVA